MPQKLHSFSQFTAVKTYKSQVICQVITTLDYKPITPFVKLNTKPITIALLGNQ